MEPPSAGLPGVYSKAILAAMVGLFLSVCFSPPGAPAFLELPKADSTEPGK